MQFEVAVAYGNGQFMTLLGARVGAFVHLGGEVGVPVAAPLFGDEHRDVRIVQQFLGGAAVLRVNRDTDRCRDVGHGTIAFDRLPHRGQQPVDQFFDSVEILDTGDQHGEFVAPESADDVVLARSVLKPGRDGRQHDVPEAMPEAVVDLFEGVEVDPQHGKAHGVGVD